MEKKTLKKRNGVGRVKRPIPKEVSFPFPMLQFLRYFLGSFDSVAGQLVTLTSLHMIIKLCIFIKVFIATTITMMK